LQARHHVLQTIAVDSLLSVFLTIQRGIFSPSILSDFLPVMLSLQKKKKLRKKVSGTKLG